MVTTVRLKPETEAMARQLAKITGKTISDVIREAVDSYCDKVLKANTQDLTTTVPASQGKLTV